MPNSIFLTILTLALSGTTAAYGQTFERPEPKAGFSYSEYYCTNRGVRVEVDNTSCLIIGDRQVSAVCDVSLNSPIWRVSDETCVPEPEILKAAGE